MTELRSDQTRLDELAEEFAERCRRGERPSVADYVAAHPDLAERIEDLFPTLEMMEGVDRGREAEPPKSTRQPALAELGDYRIVREIGHGGMGVVYEAEQVSLGRRVAVKVLPPQLLHDATHAQRFVREAKAAARLHHTNIVPVFGVGEQDGLHYYVMQSTCRRLPRPPFTTCRNCRSTTSRGTRTDRGLPPPPWMPLRPSSRWGRRRVAGSRWSNDRSTDAA